MCQKAFGSLYAPLTLSRHEDFAWTRGEPASFASSPDVTRGFCASCGTPLTFVHKGSPHLNVSIGSLDTPEIARPETQIGIESRVSWHADLPTLDEQSTDQALDADRVSRVVSFQHPDNDTDDWPSGQ